MKTISGILILVTFLWSQGTISPFLEIRPYAPPTYEQYAIHASVDHFYPTQTANHLFIRLDGDSVSSSDPPASTCLDGQTCYDGHSGVDWWMPRGTPLLAAAAGTIVWAAFEEGVNPCPNGKPPNGKLGVVIIDHHNGYYSTYLHLDPPIPVKVGDDVAIGDTIGYCGDTGCASVTHLHFEMRKGAYYFDQQKSWVVDPFGWWGKGQDPIKDMRNASSVWLWKSSNLIDDGDNGFERFYGPEWEHLDYGYNGDAWAVPAVKGENISRHFAIWVPQLSVDATYHIQVFIPQDARAAHRAIYELYVRQPGGTTSMHHIVVAQDSIQDAFFTIATVHLPKGANCMLILRDRVGENSSGNHVLFDAVRFLKTSTGLPTENAELPGSEKLILFPNRPNPLNQEHLNGGTFFQFKLSEPNFINIRILNILGQCVKKISLGNLGKGEHRIFWNGKGEFDQKLPQGIYFFSISCCKKRFAEKFILLH